MTCGSCGHEFCWICSKPYTVMTPLNSIRPVLINHRTTISPEDAQCMVDHLWAARVRDRNHLDRREPNQPVVGFLLNLAGGSDSSDSFGFFGSDSESDSESSGEPLVLRLTVRHPQSPNVCQLTHLSHRKAYTTDL